MEIFWHVQWGRNVSLHAKLIFYAIHCIDLEESFVYETMQKWHCSSLVKNPEIQSYPIVCRTECFSMIHVKREMNNKVLKY